MTSDLFSRALDNPEELPESIKDHIDVEDITSDEEAETEVQGTKNDEQQKTNNSEDASASSDSNGETDSSSDDDDSEDASTSSSDEEINVIDEEDEDGSAAQGPIRSKNEITEEPAFEIPEDFEIGPDTPIREIGFVKSAFDFNIIIQSLNSAEQRVLKENSLLCLQDRQLLGPLCEVFGPLQAPFYRVSFPKEKAELFEKLRQMVGEKVFYVAPEAHWLDTFELKRIRGTDASNGFDEELPEEEQEFSDDEKEAEFKKLKKQSKKRKTASGNNTEPVSSKNYSGDSRTHGRPQPAGPISESGSTPTSGLYRPRNARQHEARTTNPPTVHQQESYHAPSPVVAQSPFVPNQSIQQGFPYQQGYPYQHQPYYQQYPQHIPQAYPPQYSQPYPPQHFQQHTPQHTSPQPQMQYPGVYASQYTPPQTSLQSGYPAQNQNIQQVLQLQQILLNQQQQQQQQQQQPHDGQNRR